MPQYGDVARTEDNQYAVFWRLGNPLQIRKDAQVAIVPPPGYPVRERIIARRGIGPSKVNGEPKSYLLGEFGVKKVLPCG